MKQAVPEQPVPIFRRYRRSWMKGCTCPMFAAKEAADLQNERRSGRVRETGIKGEQ